jgi:hypothetical protein
MQKRYKLIKEYPGSPELNYTISTPHLKGCLNNLAYYNGIWFEPEKTPEFWKEIPFMFTTEDKVNIYYGENYYLLALKDWSISSLIAFTRNKKATDLELQQYHNKYKEFSTLEIAKKYIEINKPKYIVTSYYSMMKNNIYDLNTAGDYVVRNAYLTVYPKESFLNCPIHSVKRLSDNEVFTVGDKVKIKSVNSNLEEEIIASFDFWLPFIDDLIKYKVIGLYNDTNTKIYENDLCYVVSKECGSSIIGEYKLDNIIMHYLPDRNLYFSTKEAAQNHIDSKTLFTTEDGVNIKKGDKFYGVWKDKNSQASHLNSDYATIAILKSHSDGMFTFSTKEKAEEYILYNKPCLSLNDIATIYVTANSKNVKCEQAQKLLKLVKEKLGVNN